MLLKLDLQLFAEEFGGYDPSTAYEGIAAPQDGGMVQPEGQGQEPQVELQSEPPVLDFGGRKLPANEDLMGLHKDYTEQQRYITALQDQVNAYKQLAQQVQQQPQVQAQAQPEITADTATWDEETWAKFYENPNEVMGPIIQGAIESFAAEKLNPIIQEREWNNEIQRMYDQFPDFNEHIADIQALVNQYPDIYADRQGGLEQAYYRAVAEKARATSPAQLAQDPQFLNQYVMNNPNVQTQMLNQYFQQKQQTNQQVPVAMGRGAGGFTPQSPDSSPQTLREASRAFLKNLGVR
jgi:hypothetical protein